MAYAAAWSWLSRSGRIRSCVWESHESGRLRGGCLYERQVWCYRWLWCRRQNSISAATAESSVLTRLLLVATAHSDPSSLGSTATPVTFPSSRALAPNGRPRDVAECDFRAKFHRPELHRHTTLHAVAQWRPLSAFSSSAMVAVSTLSPGSSHKARGSTRST